MSTSILAALLLALFAAVMMRLLDGDWRTCVRLLRLLRWFVIPILLLHLLFTPGQLLLPGFPLGISREGVIQGLWLSMHLAAIYAMAVLMFRLLMNSEWLRLLALLPRYGERIMIQSLLMISMKQQMGNVLLDLKLQFRLRYDWKKVPLLLIAAFRQALANATIHAQIMWLRWPTLSAPIVTPVGERRINAAQRYLFSVVWSICGFAGLLYPWVI